MRKSIYIAAVCVLSFQACEKGLIVEETEYNNGFVENEIRCLVTAGLPSEQRYPETRVVLDGDSPSSPIVAQWQGSSIDYQDKFAILGYDSSGNIAHITNASRLAEETDDSITGTFEFSIDKDYWIEDLEFRSFYPFYPIKNYDVLYYTGSDDDKDNWVYKFSEQTGHFDDLTNNLFMTGPRLDIDDPYVEFQYGIAILRLSNLSIPGLEGQTVSRIKVRSNAIRDAVSYRYTFSDYYAAGNEISLNGSFLVNANGLIEESIYLVFYPSSELLQYFSISLESNGKEYFYSYSGALSSFATGKVYSLNGAKLTYRDTSPDYNWYLNPSGEDLYFISNAKEFLGFQRIVNGDESALSIVGIEEADKFESKTIELASGSTIDLSDILNPGENWIPIDGFKGTLKGHGASIVNLYIDGSFHYNGAKIGLFAYLENASIESLTVSGVLDANGCYNGSIGGIVGYCYQSSILNCTTSLSILHSGGYGNSVGGLAGRSMGSFIVGCVDFSTINVITDSRDTDYVGGIAGYCYYSLYSKIVGCAHFSGQVRSTEISRVGGILGHDPDGRNEIIACYNNATIRGTRPGQILGGCGLGKGSPRITSSYYSGDGDAYHGVGSLNGTGSINDMYDYGTQGVHQETEMTAACDDMNTKIDEWNSSNPSMQCSRRYYFDNGQIVFI